MLFFANHIADLAVIQVNNLFSGAAFAVQPREKQQCAALAVIYALKFLAAANGPVHGVGLNTQFPFQFVQKVKGILGFPIHFIDKGKNRDVPHGADLKKLPRLGFHALAAVDHHHGGVRRHQGAVGVLGKVLVAGSVQNVDTKAVPLELHHGGSNGNAALLFNFHPVGHGSPAVFLAFDRACLSDSAAVQQEFFG